MQVEPTIPPASFAGISLRWSAWPHVPPRDYYSGTLTYRRLSSTASASGSRAAVPSRNLSGKAGFRSLQLGRPGGARLPGQPASVAQTYLTLNNMVQTPASSASGWPTSCTARSGCRRRGWPTSACGSTAPTGACTCTWSPSTAASWPAGSRPTTA
jgi:hypothetical protein